MFVVEVFVIIIVWIVRLYKKVKFVKGDLKLLISLVFDILLIICFVGFV